nr:RNA methyltransferase [Candidatus Delongbacteria bacterium]
PLSRAMTRHIRNLKDKRFRNRYRQTLIEGDKLVMEALTWYGGYIDMLVVRGEDPPRCWLTACSVPIYAAPESVFDELSLEKTPSGIMAVIAVPPAEPFDPGPQILVLDAIMDPGNMGSLLRSAEAFGIKSVITDIGCVELSNPKVIKASMGSYFRLNRHEHWRSDQILGLMKNHHYQALALDSRGGDSIWDYRPHRPWLLMVGSESHGLSPDFTPYMTCLHIPMAGKAESLNASVSGAIALAVLTRNTPPMT